MAGSRVSETRMHWVRWLLTTGWLLIIASLFFDPFTARFTSPDHPWSPLRLADKCVAVQGRCLVESPYPLGTTIFWGAVVPAGIFILLVFGHELWRRICPLSFLSQIPRALGRQRQTAKRNPKTGEIRHQLARVPPDSWLAKYYPFLQFGWLYAGLCGRILFFNADRLVLAAWLLFTIAAAVTVGWLYGGKAWCQYFCPMAPVQSVYSTPTSLLGSSAPMSPTTITQSMCRTVDANGEEQSACVACQQPCIDIDAERMYWARLEQPSFAFERYAYVGLVVGYFLYYYLYAGNWDYYFSGAWARQPDQLATLLSPGLYLFGRAINIPRLVVVPLLLGLFSWLGWLAGRTVEAWMRRRVRRAGAEPDRLLIRHRVFLAATFLVFNFFFLFAGRPLLQLAPAWVQYLFDMALVATSSLWLVRNWHRSPALYGRENLAERFRRQLQKLGLDVGRFLEGRSLDDLNTDEVYVLARILPGFGSEQRHEAYKGVVRDALAEGYVNVSSSLEVLRRMRQELGISDDEHRQLLDELGVEDPTLLDPDQRRSLEDQVRLSGYRRSLERLLRLQSRIGADGGGDRGGGGQAGDAALLDSIGSQYSISAQEEARILEAASPAEAAHHRAEMLLQRLEDLGLAARSLREPMLRHQPAPVALLEDRLRLRQELCLSAILDCLVQLESAAERQELLDRLSIAAPPSLPELLDQERWRTKLPAALIDRLGAGHRAGTQPAADLPVATTLDQLERLAQDPDPIAATAAMVLATSLDWQRGRSLAAALAAAERPAWVRTTAAQLLTLKPPLPLAALPEFEKRVVLATSDFFHRTWTDTLDLLADHAEIRSYAAGEAITAAGDSCRELLLLIEGEARVEERSGDQVRFRALRAGQVLDELEVLTHSNSENTIVAETAGTRVLAVPVDCFDAALERDPDFARRVLALETRQLQRVTREFNPAA
ncbi:MAG: cyclic nucleotide-binding domain-containing protein [Cyanobacteria bacterium]|nr:cyclic nucleotide-binding domain-containing protein [Cyanobacteriota bacterium]